MHVESPGWIVFLIESGIVIEVLACAKQLSRLLLNMFLIITVESILRIMLSSTGRCRTLGGLIVPTHPKESLFLKEVKFATANAF
ncbi:MAG: hypothetical protein COB66_03985 [Coxiella sp. (in: Bacteria)]|nr:MAG: hypothetical protein COB66_03985 [Coxiella sp. (in: g-proteobacteria)]